jgi:hypothetical protein
VAVLAGVWLAACEAPLRASVCTAIGVQALTVGVTDGATGARICDASVTAVDGAFRAELMMFGSASGCTYSGPTERAGGYQVTVTRAGYQAAVRRDVVVAADECHVIPVRLDIALTRVP